MAPALGPLQEKPRVSIRELAEKIGSYCYRVGSSIGSDRWGDGEDALRRDLDHVRGELAAAQAGKSSAENALYDVRQELRDAQRELREWQADYRRMVNRMSGRSASPGKRRRNEYDY